MLCVPMFTRIFQIFCYLVTRMYQIFWSFVWNYIFLFFIFISTTPSFSRFWAPLPLRGLRQWPNWPSGRTGPSGKFWIWTTQTGIIERTRKKVKIHPCLSLFFPLSLSLSKKNLWFFLLAKISKNCFLWMVC